MEGERVPPNLFSAGFAGKKGCERGSARLGLEFTFERYYKEFMFKKSLIATILLGIGMGFFLEKAPASQSVEEAHSAPEEECGDGLRSSAQSTKRNSILLEILDVSKNPISRKKLGQLLEAGVGGVTLSESSVDRLIHVLRGEKLIKGVKVKNKGTGNDADPSRVGYEITDKGRESIRRLSRREYQVLMIVDATTEAGFPVKIQKIELLKYHELAIMQILEGKYNLTRDVLETQFRERKWSHALLADAIRLMRSTHHASLVESDFEATQHRKVYWLTDYGRRVLKAWGEQKDRWLQLEQDRQEKGT